MKVVLDDVYGNDGFMMIMNKLFIEDFGGEVA